MRTGIGYDIHRLTPSPDGKGFPVGGVQIPADVTVTAHSDGDVLLHALVDAMLGALALGDIGEWFPDKHPENRGRNSREFVDRVSAKIADLGWRVTQVDANILLERPKLSPFKTAIREQLAKLLNLELSAVSVKAKTMESLGPIGEGKAVAAQVLVTVIQG